VSPRTFVAVGVPPSVRDEMARSTASLRRTDAGLRATAPAGWHLTLAFLGELTEERAALAATVTAQALATHAPRPAPWLGLGAADRFGDRVLYVPVHDDPAGALARFAEDLRAALATAGFALPSTRFHPHVTLARARRSRPVTPADVARLVVPARRWQPGTVGVWVTADRDAPRPYEVLAELAWPAGPASPEEVGAG
jgi:RNA 2',3'-cyclic 3'-phosphodiesterase